MNNINDPIGPGPGGLDKFYVDYRSGKTSSLEVTKKYLNRIGRLDHKLNAFQYINETRALETARAMDGLLKSGVDLGPLMGVPVAVKDVFSITGFPVPTAGSLIDQTDIIGTTDGTFINALKKCGVVILGTTKSVEFCLGITGVSRPLGTPWNPWDLEDHRVPGGSSSGSAVACAAGLCAFAVGTDSGGSIRVPAAFNGLFGLKTSFGRWPIDGCFPLDTNVDTIGLLTKSAKDCQIIFNTIEKQLFGYQYKELHKNYRISNLNIGIPGNYFFDDLEEQVSAAIAQANTKLENAGALFTEINLAESSERDGYFPVSMPASLIAVLGKDNFEKNKQTIDPTISDRINTGLDVKAYQYIEICNKRNQSIKNAAKHFDDVDVIATPTTVMTPPLYSDFDDPDTAMRNAFLISRNTQPANYLSMCAVSIPLPGNDLPVGYQLIAPGGADASLLRISLAIECEFGLPKQPDLML